MIAPLDSHESPYATNRRSCSRQKVLFSSVVIREGTCGRVLNISPHGLAVQTDTELVGDEFPNFRFKFSPSVAWVEARGRVAWRSSSRNVVGIEFVDLTDEIQKQIQTWMDWKKESAELSKANKSVAECALNESSETKVPLETTENAAEADVATEITPEAPALETESVELAGENQKPREITTAEFVFPTGPTNLSAENESRASMNATAEDQVEKGDPRIAAEGATHVKVAGGMSSRLKLAGLALAMILLLSAVFVRRNHEQKSSNSPQTKGIAPAPHPYSPASQLAPPVGNASATHSQAISSTANPAVPSVPSSDRKPILDGPTFVLQVAAMAHEENANALAASLRRMDFPAFVLKLPAERFHHVLVGPYDSANAAIETQKALEKRGYKPIRTEWKVSSR